MIKRLLCTFAGLILIAGAVSAQPPNYAFQAASGTYTPISGGTAVILTYGGVTNNDDGIAIPANAVPIGFTFNYNGANYTAIKPCANGFASFSTTALTNNTDTWTNNLNSGPATNQRPLIAPLWDDMDMTGGIVSYLLSGVAPNRVLTIEWSMCKWDYNALSGVISFQAKLYETTNVIEFIYRQESGAIVPNNGGASIGLSGAASGSFLSLNNSGASPNVSAATETSDLVTKPATGQTYRWIPYCAATGTNTTGEKVSNFTYNTINNNSASTAIYENFSNILTTISLFPNSVLPFSVTVSSFTATDQVVMFIDFNHNGNFGDAGETIFTSTLPLAVGTVTGNITIPPISSIVLQGRTRLRIRLHDSGTGPNATSCGASTNGQVEDYSIDIQPCFAGAISTQPSNTSICNGGNGSISIATTGSSLTYQWQLSTNGGSSYSNITNAAPYSGVTTTTLNITGTTTAMNAYKYRAVINGLCTPANSLSGEAILTVNAPGAITANPVNSTICQGKNTSFTVGASGSSPIYQWQVSTDGGITYTNLAGANSPSLSLTAVSNSMSLNRYRAVVTVASCGSVISGAAILKVNPLPDVTLSSAQFTQLHPGLTTTLFATSNPAGATYSWTLDGSVIPGVIASTLVANVNGLGKYKATVTDINGCTNITNEVILTSLPNDRLFIYPNPTSDGIFHVRLFSFLLTDHRRTITIYNVLGELVARKDFDLATNYQETTFDFGRMPPGVYIVKVRHRYESTVVVGKLIVK